MLWISLVIVLQVVGGGISLPDQNGTENRIPYNDLNVRYDHCRAPQVLNRATWQCECPPPLQASGDECICDGCLVNTASASYAEKLSREPPEFVSGFLRKLHQEDVDDAAGNEVSNRMFWGIEPARRTRMSAIRRMIRRYAKGIIDLLNVVESHCAGTGRRSGPPRIILQKDPALVKFLRGLRLGKRRHEMRLKKINWDQARIVRMRKPGETFSDTTLGGETSGSASLGESKAFGKVASYFGTGSVSLGAGGGSAGAAAFTGKGSSGVGVESRGAKAMGRSVVGKKAVRGTSMTAVIVGDGDAVGTNSRTMAASASATAVSTKAVATAGAAAYGAASAAASATPGDGAAHGAGTYDDDDIVASAGVDGGGGPVAEASASGNPTDDMEKFLRRQREKHTPDDFATETRHDDWFTY